MLAHLLTISALIVYVSCIATLTSSTLPVTGMVKTLSSDVIEIRYPTILPQKKSEFRYFEFSISVLIPQLLDAPIPFYEKGT